jgi:hypothetical protein
LNDSANSHAFHLLEAEVGESLSERSGSQAERVFQQLLDYAQATDDSLHDVEGPIQFAVAARPGTVTTERAEAR